MTIEDINILSKKCVDKKICIHILLESFYKKECYLLRFIEERNHQSWTNTIITDFLCFDIVQVKVATKTVI